MPGAGRNPWPPCIKKHGEGTTGSAESSGIPCAMVLTLMARSPWEPGFLAPIARRIIWRAWPQRREARTTRFRVRNGSVRLASRYVHRIPLSTSVTTAKRPSCEGGTMANKTEISDKRKLFYATGLDALLIIGSDLPVGQRSLCFQIPCTPGSGDPPGFAMKSPLDINDRIFRSQDGYENSNIADTEPPDVIVHLLGVEPVINDKLIEFALVLNLYRLPFTNSKDSPLPARLVNRRTHAINLLDWPQT
jgi:hypothetical protein